MWETEVLGIGVESKLRDSSLFPQRAAPASGKTAIYYDTYQQYRVGF